MTRRLPHAAAEGLPRRADNTFRIKQALAAARRGRAAGAAAAADESAAGRRSQYGQQPGRTRRCRAAGPSRPAAAAAGCRPARQPAAGPRGGQPSAAYGTVAIRVQPADAEVTRSTARTGAVRPGRIASSIEVAEGSHTVEIRKPGFRTYVTQVDVQPRRDDAAERQPAAGVGTVRLKADTTFVRGVRPRVQSGPRAFAVS